jgi:hypothetical protein
MQIVDLKQNSEKWFEFRLGKIKGSSLSAMYSARQYTKDDVIKLLEARKAIFKKSASKPELETFLTEEDKAILAASAEKKLEFYNVMAERLAIKRDDEIRMNRGHRLEDAGAQRFADDYKKKLIKVGCCVSDIDPRIIDSPDRLVEAKKPGIYTEAVEVKCLSSGRHLQAIIENEVPEEFFAQKVQYFVVNEKLEKLYFVFYDDSFKYKNLQLHVIVVTRESLGNWIDIMLRYQLAQLKEMDEIVERLAF